MLDICDALRDGSFMPHAASHGIQIAGGIIHQITSAHHLGMAGRLQKRAAEDPVMLVLAGPQWNAFPLCRASNVMVRSTCARWRPRFSGCESFLPAGTRLTQATIRWLAQRLDARYFISTKSQPKLPPVRARSYSSIKPVGMAASFSRSRARFRSCRCCPAHPNSTTTKTSSNS